MFDLQSNLGLTRGILDISVEKGTLVALVLEWVAPHCFGCSHGSMEKKKLIFLGFSGSNTQIEDIQNTYHHDTFY